MTAGTSIASVMFDVWLLGLFIFEYDKDNLVLDQVTREAVLPEGADGPQSSEDVFPNREFEEWIEVCSITYKHSIYQTIKPM